MTRSKPQKQVIISCILYLYLAFQLYITMLKWIYVCWTYIFNHLKQVLQAYKYLTLELVFFSGIYQFTSNTFMVESN